MRSRLFLAALAVALVAALSPGSVFAHSGGTDRNGCHTDHKTGLKHCH